MARCASRDATKRAHAEGRLSAPSGQQQYQYLHRRGAENAEVAEAMRVRVFLCVLCVLCASAPLRWKLFFSSAVETLLPQWAASRHLPRFHLKLLVRGPR